MTTTVAYEITRDGKVGAVRDVTGRTLWMLPGRDFREDAADERRTPTMPREFRTDDPSREPKTDAELQAEALRMLRAQKAAQAVLDREAAQADDRAAATRAMLADMRQPDHSALYADVATAREQMKRDLESAYLTAPAAPGAKRDSDRTARMPDGSHVDSYEKYKAHLENAWRGDGR